MGAGRHANMAPGERQWYARKGVKRSCTPGLAMTVLLAACSGNAGKAGVSGSGQASHEPGDARAGQVRILAVSSAAELMSALSRPLDSVELRLAPGVYRLTARPGTDATCGNCQDPDQPVLMSYGLRVSGRKVRIVGPAGPASPPGDEAVIHTSAGYGVFFVDCQECAIERVTITGGERDADSNATSGAIVVARSSVAVRGTRITGNIGDAGVIARSVVGIAGIVGREGARLEIEGNRIVQSSWDGIALYRGAEAVIRDNVIDGVDKARGVEAGGGRGVGIGVTWNARATIEGNLVKRYWKGIGVFVDASATVRRNIVEDVLTWGIACWDAAQGAPVAAIADNLIYRTGACGASIQRERPAGQGEAPGRFAGNILVETAQDPRYDAPEHYCEQTALAVHAAPEEFAITGNLFHGNRRVSDALPDQDIPREELMARAAPLLDVLAGLAVASESDALRALGR
jgi:hypothetical protein